MALMNIAIFSCVGSDLCGKRCVFMVFLMRPEGLTCFRSGKRNVAYGHFEAPEGAKPNMVEILGAERRLVRVSKKREGSKYGRSFNISSGRVPTNYYTLQQ